MSLDEGPQLDANGIVGIISNATVYVILAEG